jgi:Sel1 repeat
MQILQAKHALSAAVASLIGCSAISSAYADQDRVRYGTRTSQFTSAACQRSRNVVPFARIQEPNSDEHKQAVAADRAKKFPEAIQLFQKIDRDDIAAISRLSATTPWLDVIDGKYVGSLIDARSKLGYYYQNGLGVQQSYSQAAGWYQKAISTVIFDDRGCEIIGDAGGAFAQLGLLYAYGLGVPRDRNKTQDLWDKLPSYSAYKILLNNGALPQTYAEFQRMDFRAVASKLPQRIDAQPEAEAKRREPAKPVAAAPSSKDYNALLDKVVSEDSVGWKYNKYEKGSMHGAKRWLYDGEDGDGSIKIRGMYSNIGGAYGAVIVKIAPDGQVICLKYDDEFGNCRKPYDPVKVRREQVIEAKNATDQKSLKNQAETAGGTLFRCQDFVSSQRAQELLLVNERNRTVLITSIGLQCTVLYRDGDFRSLIVEPGLGCTLTPSEPVHQKVEFFDISDDRGVRISEVSDDSGVAMSVTLMFRSGVLSRDGSPIEQCHKPHS